jgi:hypothetical protein
MDIQETNNSVLKFAKHHVFDLYVAKKVSYGPVGILRITIESQKTHYESDLLSFRFSRCAAYCSTYNTTTYHICVGGGGGFSSL